MICPVVLLNEFAESSLRSPESPVLGTTTGIMISEHRFRFPRSRTTWMSLVVANYGDVERFWGTGAAKVRAPDNVVDGVFRWADPRTARIAIGSVGDQPSPLRWKGDREDCHG